jgi:N-hydroxyarylamine O-acetyltransferase
MAPALDLDAYLARIGCEEELGPNAASLRTLHRLHPMAIPFENLNSLAGLPVLLDVEALCEKMVGAGRGGYCFEQNRLFAAVLEQVGFDVIPLSARVLWGQAQPYANPRTHMALLVECEDTAFLCDVGFGGCTPTAPIELVAGVVQQSPHERLRLLRADEEFELQVMLAEAWRPMYRFDLQRQQYVDYEMGNHYVTTHPNSPFHSVLMAGRPYEGGRYALRNNVLTTYPAGGHPVEQVLNDVAAVRATLSDAFGIRIPARAEVEQALERLVDADGRAA